MDRAAEAELDVTLGQLIEDVAGVGQRSGEPVQLGHHEGVARSAGGEGQSETWTVAVGAGQAVVEVNAVIAYSQRA